MQPPHAPPLSPALPWPTGLLGRSKVLQTALLLVVLVGSNMIISDGVLTPAISVVSAMEGVQFQTGLSQGGARHSTTQHSAHSTAQHRHHAAACPQHCAARHCCCTA